MPSSKLPSASAGLPFDTAGLDRLRRPVWVFDDVRKRKVYANPAALTLWGAETLDALLARDFSSQSPAVRIRMEAIRQKIARGETVIDRWTFYPLGEPACVSVAISAITLTDGGEAMLFEAVPVEPEPDEQRAAEALRHTPVLVGLFDAGGRRLFANPSHLAAFPDQTRFHQAFADPDEADRIWRAALSEDAWSGPCRVLARDGARWHGLDARRTRDPVTGAVGVLVNQADMSAEIEARGELAEARIRAEEAARYKEEFLANMSHELRTPLTSVIGFAGLLRVGPLGPEQAHYLDRIDAAGLALMSTLNDILDLSKLEAGGVTLEKRPFALDALLDQALGMIETQASAKGLSLTKIVDEAAPAFVVGDPERLRQILVNLLGNAVKFTSQGGVTLSARRLASDGDDVARIELAVTDTGIGLARDMLGHVFERFTQADATVARRFGGTGLGLSITKRLAQAMGGEVGASSDLGQGARFWCVLPLPIALAAAKTASVAGPETAPAVGVRVLVADDNAANRELVSALLRSVGHRVDLAANGVEAVAAVSRGGYDVVLMDVRMPVQDGISATRAIRDLDGPASRVPIIALSANVLAEQIETYRASGMDDHIGKPIATGELLAKVARWSGAAHVRSHPLAPT